MSLYTGFQGSIEGRALGACSAVDRDPGKLQVVTVMLCFRS